MSAGKVLETLRARWVRAGFPDFPVWIALCLDAVAAGSGVLAVLQREEFLGPAAVAVAMFIPLLVELSGRKMPWPILTLLVVSGVSALIVLYPVGEFDFAVFVLVMFAGHMGAIESVGRSAPATGVAVVTLIGLDLTGRFDGGVFWVLVVLVGWDIGFIMQYQQRRIEQELAAQAAREQKAAVEERQRIAREVHDVIAHSLSVTMLHLTAARRILEHEEHDDTDDAIDAYSHEDIAEAVDALREAERLGRHSMTDIRRTVGLLASGAGRAAPEPGVGDIDGLVDGFRDAGLDVRYQLRGDPQEVSASAGLGLYRIMQESLANAAKHAPHAGVRANLDLAGSPHRLSVWNDLPETTGVRRDEGGAGLKGMRERSELLGGTFRAGPNGTGWLVEVEFPATERTDDAGDAESCGKGLLGRRTRAESR